jgi:hypothetical protein
MDRRMEIADWLIAISEKKATETEFGEWLASVCVRVESEPEAE